MTPRPPRRPRRPPPRPGSGRRHFRTSRSPPGTETARPVSLVGRSVGRGDLTDERWERLRLFLPVSNGRSGRWQDRRQLIGGILHRLRTGVQWRDLPERFGPWKTVDERHRLWSADGTRRRPLQHVQAGADGADGVDCDVSVDPRSCVPTSTRSAPAPTCRRRWRQRGLGDGTPGRDAVAEPRRPPGGNGSGGEGLGRSRGGFTTKVHLSADGRCRPLSLVVTLGRRADRTQFDPCCRRSVFPGSVGPAREKPDGLAADKAQSNGPCRLPARTGHPAHDPGEGRQPGPPACARPHDMGDHRTSTRIGTKNATPLIGPSR
ncbi:IS5 family transposase [Streptomyces halstedii]|uniref:IS5 family transposase n=1 Tax=Streptomyces halstedii TaxID=1944 RepID=UPI0038301B04